MNLWTDKYAPIKTTDIVGQNKAVAEATTFVSNFSSGTALMITGPSGSGKSSIPESIAKEKKLSLIRLNACDKRNKLGIETFIQATQTIDLFGKGKIILIDELEGLSGGDRGAVPSIVSLIKKSKFPIFLITSDAYIPKLAPLRKMSKVIKLTKVPAPSMEKRLKEICQNEGMDVDDGVLKALSRFSQGDLRSAINDLQNTARGKKSMKMEDLESVGFRDKTSSIHETLPKIFRSGNVSAAFKAISEADKAPEELFLWLENNLRYEYRGKDLADASEMIARADVFLSLIRKERNYRFLRYAMDSMAGLATIENKSTTYVSYKMPDKIIMLGRSKIKRAMRVSLCKKIGKMTHSSSSRVRKEYLPYLSIAMQKDKAIHGVELTNEEMSMLRNS